MEWLPHLPSHPAKDLAAFTMKAAGERGVVVTTAPYGAMTALSQFFFLPFITER